MDSTIFSLTIDRNNPTIVGIGCFNPLGSIPSVTRQTRPDQQSTSHGRLPNSRASAGRQPPRRPRLQGRRARPAGRRSHTQVRRSQYSATSDQIRRRTSRVTMMKQIAASCWADARLLLLCSTLSSRRGARFPDGFSEICVDLSERARRYWRRQGAVSSGLVFF